MTADPLPPDDVVLRDLAWVRGLAQKLVSDPSLADDIVNDTWLLARTEAPKNWRQSARAWLTTVVQNRVRRMARTERRRVAREQAVAAPRVQESAAQVAARGALHREVVDAVSALAEPYRSALLWRYLDELSTCEVARRQGVSHDAARQRISRGLRLLRQRLGERRGDVRQHCEAAAITVGAGREFTVTAGALPGVAPP